MLLQTLLIKQTTAYKILKVVKCALSNLLEIDFFAFVCLSKQLVMLLELELSKLLTKLAIAQLIVD